VLGGSICLAPTPDIVTDGQRVYVDPAFSPRDAL
jgi:hypothetical protein